MAKSDCWNKSDFLSKETDAIKGLNCAISAKNWGMFSIGSRIFDKNNKMLAANVAARIDICSVLNKYPMPIPKTIKKLAIKKLTAKVVKILLTTCEKKNSMEIISMIITCRPTTDKLVK